MGATVEQALDFTKKGRRNLPCFYFDRDLGFLSNWHTHQLYSCIPNPERIIITGYKKADRHIVGQQVRKIRVKEEGFIHSALCGWTGISGRNY